MAKNIENLITNWDKILLQMKEDFEITDHVYDSFIDGIIKPIRFEKDTLYIEVPEEAYKGYLESRLSNQIRIAVAHAMKISAENLTLSFVSKNTSKEKVKNVNSDLDSILRASGINNSNNNFENFIQGQSNAVAYATSIAVAENPGQIYNPLFISCKSGLGKTHLMQAIAIHALKENPKLNVMYTTCEKFVQELLICIEKQRMPEFKTKYRSVDILLIDDIHELAGKTKTQEEFFNLFNTLYEDKKQIVLTSDKPIKELSDDIEDRVKTRIGWGSTCDMTMPDYETRIAILRSKEKIINPEFPIDNEVIKYIAQNVKTSVRDLEGQLKNIILYSKLNNKIIDLEMAKDRLTDLKNENDKKLTPEKITREVCDYFGINVLDVCGKKRNREFVYARDIAIYLCRTLIIDITQEKTGSFFGGRDHSTIINSCKKIEDKLTVDKELAQNINNIKEKLLL